MNRFNVLRSPDPDPGSGGGGTPPVASPPAIDPPGGNTPPAALLNDDHSFVDGWQDRLGEDAKGLTFKNLPDVLKSNRAATQKIAEQAQKIKELGGAEATPIPQDAAGYIAEIKLPETLPDGVTVPEGLLAAAAKYGIDNKIPPSITQKFVEFQIGEAGREAQAIKDLEFTNLNNAKKEITRVVGAENYELTIGNAKAAHDLLGLNLAPEDLTANPRLVLALSKIHKELSPGALKGLNLTTEGQTATGKLQQAEDIISNPANPDYKAFHDSSDPRHESVRERRSRLIAESAQ